MGPGVKTWKAGRANACHGISVPERKQGKVRCGPRGLTSAYFTSLEAGFLCPLLLLPFFTAFFMAFLLFIAFFCAPFMAFWVFIAFFWCSCFYREGMPSLPETSLPGVRVYSPWLWVKGLSFFVEVKLRRPPPCPSISLSLYIYKI